jgi:hypothetical protein
MSSTRTKLETPTLVCAITSQQGTQQKKKLAKFALPNLCQLLFPPRAPVTDEN